MNWGKGIMIGMGLFMSFILYMVISLMGKRVDLQSEDYYKKEIEYETEIAQIENANRLGYIVELRRENDHLFIELPDTLDLRSSNIEFIRPNDEKKDIRLEGKNEKTLIYPLSKMDVGQYDVQVQFKDNSDKVYLYKTKFYK